MSGKFSAAWSGIPWWGKLLIASLVSGIVITSCNGRPGAAPGRIDAFDSMDALSMCQMALKHASRDPEKAEIPYVTDVGDGDLAQYSWNSTTKLARMRNGLGLDVGVTANCNVSKSQKRITSLTLDGKSIL